MDVLRKEELDKRAMTYLINRVSEENIIMSNKYIRRFLLGIIPQPKRPIFSAANVEQLE